MENECSLVLFYIKYKYYNHYVIKNKNSICYSY